VHSIYKDIDLFDEINSYYKHYFFYTAKI